MLNYELDSDEVVLVECENVMPKDNSFFSSSGNLVLTNKNILFATLTFFGKVKSVDKHPISEVKVFDDTVQAKLDMKFGENPILNIFYKNGQNSYMIPDKSKAKIIVKQLNKIITGNDIEIESELAAGAAMLGEALKGTASAFMSAFGAREKEQEETVMSCPGCGASITGVKGSVVKCEFCGSTVKLI